MGRFFKPWFHPDDSRAERRLVCKLDILITLYAFVLYWCKYLDQANISYDLPLSVPARGDIADQCIDNAYVSGMSADLGFHGNELVHFQTMYSLGAVVGQLPFAILFTKLPMKYVIPGLDVGWGIFTLVQYRANSYSEMMAYRFLVGLFEAAFFPGIHYIFGSWYRGDEISRRGGVFYVGLYLGTLTAGLLQAAAVNNLDGIHGLAGWRWMFIINAGITIPLGIIGFFVLPGTPDKCKSPFLTKEEVQLARKRLEKAGHQPPTGFSWQKFKRIFTSWRIYILIIWDIFFWNAGTSSSAGAYILWLKSLKRFSTAKINNLSTTAPALGIFYVLFICFGADLFLTRAGAITLAHTWNFIGLTILSIWHVPESAKWFAFNTLSATNSMSSVLYGWANDILKHDADERSFALIAMNTIAQSTTVWTPLLTLPTVEAPRFPKGYPFSAVSAVCCIAMTWVVKYLHDRQERQIVQEKIEDPAHPTTEKQAKMSVEAVAPTST